MQWAKTAKSSTPIVLLFISFVLLLLVNLGGTSDKKFASRFYFSRVTNHQGRDSRWTMYALCHKLRHDKYECSKKKSMFPYEPALQLPDAPEKFETDRNHYRDLSKAGYVLVLSGMCSSIWAVVHGLTRRFMPCMNTPFWTGTTAVQAFLFTALGAALETAAHRQGVKVFKDAGWRAKVGPAAFACMWLSAVLLLFATIMLFSAPRENKHKQTKEEMAMEEPINGYQNYNGQYQGNYQMGNYQEPYQYQKNY